MGRRKDKDSHCENGWHIWVRVIDGRTYAPGYHTDACLKCHTHRGVKAHYGPHEHDWYAIPDPAGYVGEECYTCGINKDNYDEATTTVTDAPPPPASDGGVAMIFRTAYASQHGESFRTARNEHPVSCAGCNCEPGESCDTKKRCHYCGHSKTACDGYRSGTYAGHNEPHSCCERCDHRAT